MDGPAYVSHDVDRLAATEYAVHANPDCVQQTRFGRFVHDERFPTRHDAHQLFDVRCGPRDVDALLAEVDAMYAATGVRFRKLTFHDASTVGVLVPELRARGWSCRRENLLPFARAPVRQASEDVEVRAVPFDDPDGHRATVALGTAGHLRALRYRQTQDPRLGGEALIGFVDGRAAGTTGWFVADGIARFRPVSTIPKHRRRGVATSLIRYVQQHPDVRGADGLVIFCGDDGPIPLYEQLGFVRRFEQWTCFLKLPGYPATSPPTPGVATALDLGSRIRRFLGGE